MYLLSAIKISHCFRVTSESFVYLPRVIFVSTIIDVVVDNISIFNRKAKNIAHLSLKC